MNRIFLTLTGLVMTIAGYSAVIPDGQQFRIGHLDNGLTYYLCHNESPVGCADFYIAHNVGALQEEDNQDGLAHFLEHMAFNGTAHYPDKGLLEFLAREGVRFGYNVNAYTSRTETVYNISTVPLVRESFVDSVLVVLRDWSCDISCEQSALDAERGVIHEEWRNRDGQRYRMANRQTGLLYKGGKQPRRTVLGNMDVVLNFRREEILDFYHRWYRPDLQAIIIAGDFDVDDMEARVRRTFSSIPAAVDPEQKDDYMPPVYSGARFENMSDPQLRYQVLKVFYKYPYPGRSERCTEEFFRDQLSRQIVVSVIGDRLEKACQRADSPAKSAVLVLGDESPCFYVSQFTVAPKSKEGMLDCLGMTRREVVRAVRHGISREEFEMARYSVMKRSRFNIGESDAVPSNTELAGSCVENFLRGVPCLAPAELRAVKRDVLLSLTYEDVSSYPAMMFGGDDVIYSNCFNDNDVAIIPSAREMQAVLASVDAEDVPEAYLNYARSDMSVNSDPGSIVSRKTVGSYGCRLWTLSNGARVYYQPSEPVKGGAHLVMSCCYDTGLTAFAPDEIASVQFATSFMSKHLGFRGQDRSSLMSGPALSGLTYYLSSVRSDHAVITFNSSAQRAEDSFRLAHLLLSEPYLCRETNLNRAVYDALQSLGKGRTAKDRYERQYDIARYGEHPWLADRDSASCSRVTMDYLMEIFERLYGDPSRMTLCISSDIPEAEIESCVERYVASLPVLRKAGVPSGTGRPQPCYKGEKSSYCEAPCKASPYTEVQYTFLTHMPRNHRTLATIDILDHVMSARCLDRIREERGGTYHVSFSTSVYRKGGRKPAVESLVKFRTREELKDILVSDVAELMDDMCKDGPTREEMDAAVKYLVKHYGERRQKVAASIALQNDDLNAFALYGDEDYDYPAVVKAVSAREVRRVARRLAAGARLVSVYNEK